jgi:inositol phosphorylceramide mannosyltransferase catalytic subunit
MPGEITFCSFEDGMKFSLGYSKGRESPQWDLIRNLYREYLQGSRQTPRIPKILHQIWLGSDLAGQYKTLVKSLLELHPSWEYRLWTDTDIPFDFPNRELFDRCANPGQKSDILRYAILERFGGIYLDMDFMAVRPMDPLCGIEFFAGVTYDKEPQLANGLIGCAPSHPLIKKIASFEHGFKSSDGLDVMKSTGPDYFTKMFFSSSSLHCGAVAFPNTFFYPFPNFPHDRILGEYPERYFGKDTFCCHLWHCSWLKRHRATFRERICQFFHV